MPPTPPQAMSWLQLYWWIPWGLNLLQLGVNYVGTRAANSMRMPTLESSDSYCFWFGFWNRCFGMSARADAALVGARTPKPIVVTPTTPIDAIPVGSTITLPPEPAPPKV